MEETNPTSEPQEQVQKEEIASSEDDLDVLSPIYHLNKQIEEYFPELDKIVNGQEEQKEGESSSAVVEPKETEQKDVPVTKEQVSDEKFEEIISVEPLCFVDDDPETSIHAVEKNSKPIVQESLDDPEVLKDFKTETVEEAIQKFKNQRKNLSTDEKTNATLKNKVKQTKEETPEIESFSEKIWTSKKEIEREKQNNKRIQNDKRIQNNKRIQKNKKEQDSEYLSEESSEYEEPNISKTKSSRREKSTQTSSDNIDNTQILELFKMLAGEVQELKSMIENGSQRTKPNSVMPKNPSSKSKQHSHHHIVHNHYY